MIEKVVGIFSSKKESYGLSYYWVYITLIQKVREFLLNKEAGYRF